MVRLVYVLRRKEELSLEEFQRYWREQHGPLVARYANTMRVRRYVQSHTMDSEANETMQASRGTMTAYDGVADLWWDSETDLAALGTTPEGQAAALELFEDEAKFIDFSRSVFYLTTEVPQVNPTPENIVAKVDSPIVKLCFFVNHLDNLTLADAQFYWRNNHGPLIRSQAAVTAIQRYIQVHRIESPFNNTGANPRGIMEEPFMGHAELWYNQIEISAAFAHIQTQQAVETAKADEAKFIDFKRSALWYAKEYVFIDR